MDEQQIDVVETEFIEVFKSGSDAVGATIAAADTLEAAPWHLCRDENFRARDGRGLERFGNAVLVAVVVAVSSDAAVAVW